jgi:hypothetical protein
LIRRCPPSGAALAVLVTALALAGCGHQSRSTTAAPVTTRPPQRDLRSALLTLAEVQALPHAPDGLTEQPNPPFGKVYRGDPRGPCGGTVMLLPDPDAVISFTAQPDGVTVYHLVFAMAAGRAAQFLAESRADMRPRCPAFRSRSVFGIHTTQFLGEMMTPPVGDDRLATLNRTSFAGTPDAYVAYAVIRSGDDLSWIAVITFTPIPPDFAVEVMAAAAKKLP